MTSDLTIKIVDKTASVVVMGLGYVGLPVAAAFAEVGFRVTGLDVDPAKAQALNAGRSHIPDVSDETLGPLVRDGWFTATADPGVLGSADAVIICVPTPLSKTKDPDLSAVQSAAEAVAQHAHPGMLAVLESTTYPGTTEEVFSAKLAAKGFSVGEDVFVAFSPERIDPGSIKYGFANTPKVIGGVTPACTEAALALYGQAVEHLVPVSSARSAEMVKLLENTFRAVNVGLANEMGMICDRLGIDVWEVIDAASTKPFGFMRFEPGPGLGGHCLPIDPLYLSWKMRSLNYEARFIELADSINSSMPELWVGKTAEELNEHGKPIKGSDVLVIGVAYKPGVNDVRESPALDVMALLEGRGANVAYHDPYVPEVNLDKSTYRSVPLTRERVAAADCVVITTHHQAIDWPMVAGAAQAVVDTRGVLRRIAE